MHQRRRCTAREARNPDTVRPLRQGHARRRLGPPCCSTTRSSASAIGIGILFVVLRAGRRPARRVRPRQPLPAARAPRSTPIGHHFGRRPYDNTAGNLQWLAFMTAGEGCTTTTTPRRRRPASRTAGTSSTWDGGHPRAVRARPGQAARAGRWPASRPHPAAPPDPPHSGLGRLARAGRYRAARWRSSPALFVENFNMREAAGPSTRIDLTGVFFSMAAPSPAPVTIEPHLVALISCPPDETGQRASSRSSSAGPVRGRRAGRPQRQPLHRRSGQVHLPPRAGRARLRRLRPDRRPLPDRPGPVAPSCPSPCCRRSTRAGRSGGLRCPSPLRSPSTRCRRSPWARPSATWSSGWATAPDVAVPVRHAAPRRRAGGHRRAPCRPCSTRRPSSGRPRSPCWSATGASRTDRAWRCGPAAWPARSRRCTSRPTRSQDGWQLDGLTGEAARPRRLARARRRSVHVPGRRVAPAPSVLPPRPAGDRWAGVGGARPGRQPAGHRRPGRRPRRGRARARRRGQPVDRRLAGLPPDRAALHRHRRRAQRSSTSWPAGPRSSASWRRSRPSAPTTGRWPRKGLHVGIVVDEHKLDFDRGDFLVRGVLGADRDAGARRRRRRGPDRGRPIQFHVRDAGDRRRGPRRRCSPATRPPARCSSRATAGARDMFGDAHHDAAIVHDLLGAACRRRHVLRRRARAHRRRNALHGFTASMALFGAAAGERRPPP